MSRRTGSANRSSGSSSSSSSSSSRSSGSSSRSSSSSPSSSSRRSSSSSSSRSSSPSSSSRSSSPSSSSRSSSPSSSSRSSSPSSRPSSTSRKSSSPSSSSSSSSSSKKSSSRSTQSSIASVPQSSNFITRNIPSTTIPQTITIRETNSEKTARMRAEAQARADKVTKAKEIQKGMHVAESYDIHAKKIAGVKEHGGNTDNYFVNLKTGETSQRASDVTSVNLESFLKERGYGEITKDFTFGSKTNTTPDILKPKKLTEERMAVKTREVFLRHQAEIKAKGGIIPELNLMNKEQVKKYNEISNIITNAKEIGTEEAILNASAQIDNFVSYDNPITQKPKTVGDSKVFKTESNDTSVISQGYSLEPLESNLEKEQTHENKKFVTTEKSLAIGGVGLALGVLGLIYYLNRKNKNV